MDPVLLDALWNEHRSIAVVLHAMQHLVREQSTRGTKINPAVFRAILYYLDVFPERMHHPKEEKYLFAAVSRKTSEADAILDELRQEHEGGADAIRELAQDLLRYEEGGDKEFARFASAVEQFVDGYRKHIRKEEEGVMPIARRVLNAQDWADINAAWAKTRDPLTGVETEKEYEQVLDRIVQLAPPPIGVAR